MGRVRIVTDSTADLSADVVRTLHITVIPVKVRLGSERWRDGVDMNADEFFTRLHSLPGVFPETEAPAVEEFAAVYTALARSTDAILSIHLSSRLGTTYSRALEAKERQPLHDTCRIIVMDSQLTSLGLGFVVMEAARAARSGRSLDEVARLARAMVSQTHVLFFVDTLDYLQHGGRISKIQALWGSVLGIKPLLRLEDGQIVLMEKVRTRAKALERLYEFVADFPHVEELGIVYSTQASEALNLAKRLEGVVPRSRVTITRYGPGLAAHLGPGALGVIVYEGLEQ